MITRHEIDSFQKVWNATTKEAKNGLIHVSVQLDDGHVVEADIDKLDAKTAMAWYEMVKKVWDERKDSQEAAALSAPHDGPRDGDGGLPRQPAPSPVPEAVQVHQAPVEGRRSLREELDERLLQLAEERSSLTFLLSQYERQLKERECEMDALAAALTALTAAEARLNEATRKDGGEASEDVPSKAPRKRRASRRVGTKTRSSANKGTADAGAATDKPAKEVLPAKAKGASKRDAS